MKAEELFKGSGESIGLFVCGECRGLYRNKKEAEACCERGCCTRCGKPNDQAIWTRCSACRLAVAQALTAERFAKAEKIPAAEFDGWVTDGGYGYWETVDDYLEDCDTDNEPYAAYLWACTAVPFVRINVDGLIEDIERNGYEDFSGPDLNGVDELEEAIAAFELRNKDTVRYECDYSRAIILTDGDKENTNE